MSLYSHLKRYRTQEYVMNNSGWILLDSAEQVFKLTRERVYNDKDEFEPEECPKWKMLSEILRIEIPEDMKKRHEVLPHLVSQPVVVLILCQDSRTCYQLNQYLLQGAERYLLFTAMKNDVPIKKLSKQYDSVKQSDAHMIRLQDNRTANDTNQAIATRSMTTSKAPATKPISTNESLNETKTGTKGFLRDRIAKKKEAEDNELGVEENEKAEEQPDELSKLANEAGESILFSFTLVAPN